MKQIGDEYFDSKEFRNILDSYEASVGTGHPIFMDVDDLADIADYYNMVGKKEKAIQTADLALDLNPGATLPLVFKARQALDAGDIETARRLAGQIISREDPEYTLIEAEIMIAEQRPQQADEYLTTYFENLPDEEKDDCVFDITALYLRGIQAGRQMEETGERQKTQGHQGHVRKGGFRTRRLRQEPGNIQTAR